MPAINHYYDGSSDGNATYPAGSRNTSNGPSTDFQPFNEETPYGVINNVNKKDVPIQETMSELAPQEK